MTSRPLPLLCVPLLALPLLLGGASPAAAVEFRFGTNEGNAINGRAAATLTGGGFALSLGTTAPGAVIAEISQSGMGVNSGAIAGVTDGSTDKFDLLGGVSPLSGMGEQISFSFDQPGVLTGLDFDGVKDEDYEFFLLQTATSTDLYFFDSFAGSTADPSLIDVPGMVVFLQEDPQLGGGSPIDDRSPTLAIPFAAGQEFLLTYGELAVGGGGNGARLQGITVRAVPEPAAAALVGCVLTLGTAGRRRAT
ncbi:MAG: hypothetical protein AAF790_01835 [Planctomycetota bacterium]